MKLFLIDITKLTPNSTPSNTFRHGCFTKKHITITSHVIEAEKLIGIVLLVSSIESLVVDILLYTQRR